MRPGAVNNLAFAIGPCHVPPLLAAVSGVGRGNDGGRLLGVVSVAGTIRFSASSAILKLEEGPRGVVLSREDSGHSLCLDFM